MNEILYLLIAASTAHGLASALRRFRIPHVPLLILAGGALDYLDIPISSEIAKDILLLGLTFLVFLSGTTLNPWRIGRDGWPAVLFGASQFSLIGLLSVGVCLAFDFSLVESLYIALGLASSSTLVIIKILQSRGELFEPFGRLMVGALLVQDLLIIIVISALSNISQGQFGVFVSIGLILALGLLGVLLKKYLVNSLLLKGGVDEEIQLVLALGVLFLFMGLSNLFNLPFIAGAFVAGISLSSFPVSAVLRGQFASLNIFFNALFFVSLGYFADFPPMGDLGRVIALSLLIIFCTPLITAGVAVLARTTLRTGIEAGLLLAQASEFSIILILVGMENGDLGQGHLNLLTSVTVITMIATPFLSNEAIASFLMRLFDWILPRFFPINEKPKARRGHYVLIGCGESALVVLKKLLRAGKEVVVIDDDAGVVRSISELGAHGILGNGKDYSVTRHACLDSAKLVISSMRKFSDNKNLLISHPEATTVVRAFDQAEARFFEEMGAISIPATEAATEDLADWIEARLPELLVEKKGLN